MPAAIRVRCPYCDAQNEIDLTKKDTSVLAEHRGWFAHPTDGKKREKVGYLDKELGIKIFNDFWSPEILPDSKELTVKCKKCEEEFHVASWPNEIKIDEYYDVEFSDCPSRPVIYRLLDLLQRRVGLHYIVSSMLISISIWLAFAVPIIIFKGGSKLVNDVFSWMAIPSMTIAILAIRFHTNNIMKSKKDIMKLLKVKTEKMRGWTYERFKCYMLGRGKPRKMLLPDVVGLLCLLIYLSYHLISVASELPNLTPFEGPFQNETVRIMYTSYASAISAPFLWGSLAFVLGTSLWLAISTTWVVYKIGAWLPLDIDVFEKMGGVEPLGHLAFSGIIPFIAAQFALIPSILLVGVRLYQLMALLVLSTLTVILFFTSTHSIHRGMKKVKEKDLADIRSVYDPKQRELLEMFSQKSKNVPPEELDYLKSLEFFKSKAASMRTWPYDLGTIAKLIGSSVLPLITVLLEMLITLAR